jgi:hypothetical protein
MTIQYKLADDSSADPDNWMLLFDLISVAGKPVDPEWTFNPYSDVRKLGSGNLRGRGFASATWHWNILRDSQREILRSFCPAPALTSKGYIRTPINETSSGEKTWKNFFVIINLPVGDEDKQAGKVLGLTIAFTNLVEVI